MLKYRCNECQACESISLTYRHLLQVSVDWLCPELWPLPVPVETAAPWPIVWSDLCLPQAGVGSFQFILFLVLGLSLAADTIELFVVAYVIPRSVSRHGNVACVVSVWFQIRPVEPIENHRSMTMGYRTGTVNRSMTCHIYFCISIRYLFYHWPLNPVRKMSYVSFISKYI